MILWSYVHHDQASDTLKTKRWLMDYLLKKKHLACQNKLEKLENLVYHEEI
jgi:hypothetical protein